MADETYEIVISATLAGQFVQTVQHVLANIAITVNPFQTALNIIDDINGNGILDAFLAMVPEDYKITSIRGRRVFPVGSATAIRVGSELSGTDGLRSGSISSAQVNPCIIWIPTATPNRVGKLFVPGISEDDIEEMALVNDIVAKYNLFATAWIGGGTLGGGDEYHGCVYSREDHSADLIFAGQVSPLIGTQRRRLRPV